MITLRAPSSKSVSHRMLIAAALARGESLVHHALASADLERTRSVLHAAGAILDDLGNGSWKVIGMPLGPIGGTKTATDCDVGESGTTCRLLTAILAAGRGLFRVHGVQRMHERPIGELTSALSALGASITFEGKEGYPPLVIHAKGLSGGDVDLSIDASSQYLSALLLAAPFCTSPLRISLTGKKIVSWPYVGLTLQVLENCGISFSVEQQQNGVWRKTAWRELKTARPGALRITAMPGAYRPGTYDVEGDWSGASYLLAAGAVGRNSVLVTGLRPDSMQGDRTILDILRSMGAACTFRPSGILVEPSALHGIEADMGNCPDLVPTVAMLAAFADGNTRIVNIAHLRIKECDRISACAALLSMAGVRSEETQDTLTIHGSGPTKPRIPAGTILPTWNDHRMAMSAALLGLVPGNSVILDDPHVVCKSFPTFWDVWSTLK